MKKILETFIKSDNKGKIKLLRQLFSSTDQRAVLLIEEIESLNLDQEITDELEKLKQSKKSNLALPDPSAKKVIRMLESQDPGSRIQGINQAKKSGEVSVMPYLIRHLSKEVNAHVASFLVSTIGALGGVKTLSIMLRYLKSEDIRIQGNAVETIGEIVRREVAPGLSEFLDSSSNRVRANAALALYSPYQDRVRDVLMDMTKSEEPNMRASAAWALGHIKEIWSVEILEKLAEDKQALVRKNALNSLSQLEIFRSSSALLRARTKVFGDPSLFSGIEGDETENKPPAKKKNQISAIHSYKSRLLENNPDLLAIGRDIVNDVQLRLLDLSGEEYSSMRGILRDIIQLNRRKKDAEARNISSLWGKIRSKEDPAISFLDKEINKKMEQLSAELREVIKKGTV